MVDDRGSEPPKSDPAGTKPDGEPSGRSASQDLADGLDLMLRAAQKAVRGVDPANLERLGRRALDSIDHLRRERVENIGRKAKQTLDPKRVEAIAEDAGKELLRVVERVAERVDSMVNGRSTPPDSDGGDEAPDQTQKRRVRIDDRDD